MKAAWIHLPPELRRTSGSIARIRTGVIAFILFLPLVIIMNAVHSTPAQFLRYMASPSPLLGVMAVVAAVTILNIRAQRVAPTFLEVYALMLPDMAERMETQYGERGAGDVIAPWIRTRQSMAQKATRWISARMGPGL